MNVDQTIALLAVRQRGHVTRGQLLHLGLEPHAIDYRVKTGRLLRVHLGVYAVGHRRLHPIDLCAAAVLACGADATLRRTSAAALWGWIKHWPAEPEVAVATCRRPHGIRTTRTTTLTRADIRTHHGIRVTSPARTIIDCASHLTDADLTRLVNDALLSKYLQPNAFQEALARTRHDPRLNLYMQPTQNGPTRSRWEDDFPNWCVDSGLPRPVMDVMLNGREVDAFFPDHNLIVELDSYEFHNTRPAFEKDRNDDAEALANGTPTVRITWDRVHGRSTTGEAERLHRILAARAKVQN